MPRKKSMLTKDQKKKVLLLEMDYYLMGLWDAMQEGNKPLIRSIKAILRDRHRRLEELGYWSSEDQGI